jgi:hypothetical protein
MDQGKQLNGKRIVQKRARGFNPFLFRIYNIEL